MSKFTLWRWIANPWLHPYNERFHRGVPMKTRTFTSVVADVTCILVLAAFGAGSAQAQPAEAVAPPGNFITPSKTIPLVPGQMLAGSDFERAQQPYIIQRLTQNVYWLEISGYQSTVVVGEVGVMVIDAPCCGRVPNYLTAIGEITDLPVTTLVYSHYHLDHVGGANDYVEHAAATNTPLRIVATTAANTKINNFGNKIPPPTELISVPRGTFDFEGMTVLVGTPPTGHSTDNSWILLEDEGVLHNADLVHPGNLEFMDFGVAENIDGYEKSVRELLSVEWQILCPAHSNIGSRSDVELVLDYLSDIRAHVQGAMSETPFDPHVQDGKSFYDWIAGFRDAIIDNTVQRLGPKWGQYPGFDTVARSHAQAMFFETYLH